MHRILVAVLMMGVLVACTAGGSPEESEAAATSDSQETACETAVREATAIDSAADTVEDLDQAISTCGSLHELRAATDAFPDALDGVDLPEFVINRCANNAELALTAVCQELT